MKFFSATLRTNFFLLRIALTNQESVPLCVYFPDSTGNSIASKQTHLSFILIADK